MVVQALVMTSSAARPDPLLAVAALVATLAGHWFFYKDHREHQGGPPAPAHVVAAKQGERSVIAM